MTDRPLPYTDKVEHIPSDEPAALREMADLFRNLLERDEQSSGHRRRDVHVKSHGCPVGEFQVLPDLPVELRQGLFAEPNSYGAVVRFSNSNPTVQADSFPDARGVAIKVQNVEGEMLNEATTDPGSQDFVLANHPVFVSRNVKDYVRLLKARAQGLKHPQTTVKAFTGGRIDPRGWHWAEALGLVRVLARVPLHPIQLTYYSMTAFRYGDYVGKFRLKPTAATAAAAEGKRRRDQDAFRHILGEIIRTQTLTFDFQVQLRTLGAEMPIENPTVTWPEQLSPYQTVARLVLPPQDLEGSPHHHGDALSFNPWNALTAHRPLGGINRSRKTAYLLSTSWRNGPAGAL